MMTLPPCPKCEGTLRVAEFDGAQCRCGFTIDGEAIVASRDVPPAVQRQMLLGAGRMAIDYSKIKKDPASLPYRVKYEPITIDKAALDAAAKKGSTFVDELARKTDKMIRDRIAALDRKLEAKYAEKYRAVLEAAQIGAITAERARELLDVEYDGLTLRECLAIDEMFRREHAVGYRGRTLNQVQRAAVSAHWSAQLRARVEASKERERQRVVVDLEVD